MTTIHAPSGALVRRPHDKQDNEHRAHSYVRPHNQRSAMPVQAHCSPRRGVPIAASSVPRRLLRLLGLDVGWQAESCVWCAACGACIARHACELRTCTAPQHVFIGRHMICSHSSCASVQEQQSTRAAPAATCMNCKACQLHARTAPRARFLVIDTHTPSSCAQH